MSDFRRSWYRRKACAAYFCKVPDLRESELGFARYGSANRGHRGVFGPFEDSFPIGIPARPGKILAIREFHVVHECVLLSNVPGLADQLVASQEDSVRKRGNVGGKIPEISAQPYFVGLFSRAWPCTEASLGSQDMILRTEAVGMFLMPRGRLGSGCLVLRADTRENPGGKNGVMIAATFNDIFQAPAYIFNPAASLPPQADYVWRIMLMLGALPAALTFYWRMQMPETARYTALVAKNAKQGSSRHVFVIRGRAQTRKRQAAAGKIGAIAGTLGFMYATESKTQPDPGYSPGIGIQNTLLLLACVNLLGVFCTFLVPESKGKSLEELSGENEEDKGGTTTA
uniref:Major facilitator superfamily (MFS) profile domain-containing protein n=1 Tax=Fagus sylvatica TaxID=28930 RepID=A0A2N9GNK7_FAGSY